MEIPYFLLASSLVKYDTMVNAIARRWTVRKGWREIDPERGRFILEPYLPIALDPPSSVVHVELSLGGVIDLSSEGFAKFDDSAAFKQ